MTFLKCVLFTYTCHARNTFLEHYIQSTHSIMVSQDRKNMLVGGQSETFASNCWKIYWHKGRWYVVKLV